MNNPFKIIVRGAVLVFALLCFGGPYLHLFFFFDNQLNASTGVDNKNGFSPVSFR